MRALARWLVDVLVLALVIGGLILIGHVAQTAMEVPAHIIGKLP